MNILFSDLQILQETKTAIEALGLVETTSIQHHAIPKMLEKRDLIGQAQTGTGKTFAFAIPILEQIDTEDKNIQALVICPTRELTLQVYKEFLKLIKFNKAVKITSIYGGESYNKQFKALAEHPQIVVATPGRAIDHLERGTLNFSSLKVLVMDEADEMLKMGFQEDLEKLLKDTPSTRQTALFSATIPAFIKKVAEKYLKNPEIIKIETPTVTVSKIDQFYYNVKKSDRDQLMLRLLDFYEPISAIIFANTKIDVDNLSAFLQKHNYEADALHGDLKQSQRDYVMGRFRSKRLKYLIATDVAARGLDISHVDMIINYEIPFEDELYVHRIGRTGRAGKAGVSISLVYPSMRGKLQMIERYIKAKLTEREIPTEEEINQRREQRNYAQILDMVVKNEVNYDEIIGKLHEDGFEDQDIISALLSKVMVEKKTYDHLEAPAKKRNDAYSDPRSSRDSRGGRSDSRSRGPRDSRDSRDSRGPKSGESRENRPARTYDSSEPRSRGVEGPYKNAMINLGKQDGLRPVALLDYLKKNADLFPKNIGDITIYPQETEFQIHPAAIKRLDEVNNKLFNGKKIKITILGNK
ncbi:MAG: DNA helicase [Tenericutes bacterium HGW-Tenericutes-2]|jgi:ATP-dependent RNA helicase DeaD|nr:MAG: DNA helicase [Tenericutes bacterium HGW-Tenericutes-2]